jgi:hypothetical protein
MDREYIIRRTQRDRSSRLMRVTHLISMPRASVLAVLAAAFVAAGVAAQTSTKPQIVQPASAETRVIGHFERIRREPPALRAFLQAMPKGADLHTHLTGAVYAESYILWAADMPLCVDLSNLGFVAALDTRMADSTRPPAGGSSRVTCRDPATQRAASDALSDPVLYRRMIDAFSSRFWHPARTAGHYQFFDSFGKFGPVAREGRGAFPEITARSVAEVAERAGLQNVQHLELMMSFGAASDGAAAGDSSLESDADFESLRLVLLAAGLRERLKERREWLDDVEKATRAILRCGTAEAMRGCAVSVRFLAYALRGLPPQQVFAQALLAFELAAGDDRVAGVNLVMPEDWFIPMRDYALHMRMYRFLRTQYPTVNIALHAGELALGLVPPEQLGRHVRQAIEVAGAQRIGHGTDVMHDSNPSGLLQMMASRRIPVEISLSSSDLILGIRGARHPLRQFLRAGVPVVIATDDEGVSRSDLTNEYQRAVEEHGLGYRELKDVSRNSIEYSFLPQAAKAKARSRLEAAFADFEKRFSATPK